MEIRWENYTWWYISCHILLFSNVVAITCEPVRNANSQLPPQTYRILIRIFNEISKWFIRTLNFKKQIDTHHVHSTADEYILCARHMETNTAEQCSSASAGSFKEIQSLRPNPKPSESPGVRTGKMFLQPFKWCLCILKFEKHYSRKVDCKLCILKLSPKNSQKNPKHRAIPNQLNSNFCDENSGICIFLKRFSKWF